MYSLVLYSEFSEQSEGEECKLSWWAYLRDWNARELPTFDNVVLWWRNTSRWFSHTSLPARRVERTLCCKQRPHLTHEQGWCFIDGDIQFCHIDSFNNNFMSLLCMLLFSYKPSEDFTLWGVYFSIYSTLHIFFSPESSLEATNQRGNNQRIQGRL